jgi:hypothetical protein
MEMSCGDDGQIVGGASGDDVRKQRLTKQQSKAHSVMKDCLSAAAKGWLEG